MGSHIDSKKIVEKFLFPFLFPAYTYRLPFIIYISTYEVGNALSFFLLTQLILQWRRTVCTDIHGGVVGIGNKFLMILEMGYVQKIHLCTCIHIILEKDITGTLL